MLKNVHVKVFDQNTYTNGDGEFEIILPLNTDVPDTIWVDVTYRGSSQSEPFVTAETDNLVIEINSTDDLFWARSWDLVTEDSFSDLRNPNWYVGDVNNEVEDYESMNFSIDQGRYNWKLYARHSIMRPRLYKVSPSIVDFFAKVDVRLEQEMSDTYAGIIFGKQGNPHQNGKSFFFCIYPDDTWAVYLYNDIENSSREVQRKTDYSSETEEGTELAVIVVDGDMEFFINGEFVGKYRDKSFEGGQVGLGAGRINRGLIEVSFDNFEVRRP